MQRKDWNLSHMADSPFSSVCVWVALATGLPVFLQDLEGPHM